MKPSPIQHVSDTALWVAAYRAHETMRPDALFRDPYADRLVGTRGHTIAHTMKSSKYVSWSVVIRTCIIDNYIQSAIQNGFDTILNLGAGLDSRPYRMELPNTLHWIEVDYPKMIEYKEDLLRTETPKCRLDRVKLDLSKPQERRKLFSQINSQSNKVFVLTEGVVPYLSIDDAGALADDLHSQDHFKAWVVDYFSSEVMKYMARRKFREQMKNAPFRFNPSDWKEFFERHQWKLGAIRYLGEEGERLHRPFPLPFFVTQLRKLIPVKAQSKLNRMTGYALLQPF